MSAVAAQAVQPSRKVTLVDFSDILEQSTILSRLELGSALVYKVNHPTQGDLVLVNTAGDFHGVVTC